MNDINFTEQNENYRRVEQAILYLERNFKNQPGLDEIAASVHLSKYHFQRLFKSWVGVTPSQFMHYLTVEYAKERLKDAQSIFLTTLDAGLSSPGRLHDLFINYEAMTPGEYKKGGDGLSIWYGFHPTPFGHTLLAMTERGVCALRFLSQRENEVHLENFQRNWPRAEFIEMPSKTQPVIKQLFSSASPRKPDRFHLLLKGTNFQVKVWQALLEVPFGAMVSYQDVANKIDMPSATRAVANAVANNPVAYLIPCHRVVSKSGTAHGYRWGTARKKAILGWEAARLQQSDPRLEVASVP